MTIKLSIGLLFLISFCSCSDNSREHSGFYIENGPRQGFQYADSIGPLYHYRYITTTIINDSVIPMRLEINFLKEDTTLKVSFKSKVFLLPRSLTPEKQQFDPSTSIELRKFLAKVNEAPIAFDTMLSPKGKCVMAFGILTDTKYEQPNGICLKASTRSSSTVTLGLSFDNNLIPCGQISFITN
jgi:hypothetical protein